MADFADALNQVSVIRQIVSPIEGQLAALSEAEDVLRAAMQAQHDLVELQASVLDAKQQEKDLRQVLQGLRDQQAQAQERLLEDRRNAEDEINRLRFNTAEATKASLASIHDAEAEAADRKAALDAAHETAMREARTEHLAEREHPRND